MGRNLVNNDDIDSLATSMGKLNLGEKVKAVSISQKRGRKGKKGVLTINPLQVTAITARPKEQLNSGIRKGVKKATANTFSAKQQRVSNPYVKLTL